jgi:hypothetical protein
VHNLLFVQPVQASQQLDKEGPEFLLAKVGLVLAVVVNPREHVAFLAVLHDQTDGLSGAVNE